MPLFPPRGATPRTLALTLTRSDFWPQLAHGERRFVYETVSDMMRMRLPKHQYDRFFAWVREVQASPSATMTSTGTAEIRG